MSVKQLKLKLPPSIALDERALQEHVLKDFSGGASGYQVRLMKRSIDARKKDIVVHVEVELYRNEVPPLLSYEKGKLPDVSQAKQVIIIGCGPAGLFAAHRLIELGLKPVILERGKDVQSRRRDLAAINRQHIVNPDSNYCFGEGGAGTYSDGKLYTRSGKRGSIRRILEILVAHGANPVILADAHPHIGTNKLPRLVASLRETILEHGGEIHFEQRVTDFLIRDNTIHGVQALDGKEWMGGAVILATGHSARDIFELCHQRNVYIEAKPFAMGIRLEHPQEIIDRIQYHGMVRGEVLPAAPYSIVSQESYKGEKRGVFSFCMCPGGFIVAAATAPGEVVVNGMSPSRRDSYFANSGIVVSVEPQDWQAFAHEGPLAALRLQQQLERTACAKAGGTQTAPAQQMVDFIKGKNSTDLVRTSYIPGLIPVPMREVLPPFIHHRLQSAFQTWGRKMKSFLTQEAQLVGVESRTSSPVRIPRDKETLEHVQISRLFPCGEGAGYAGGIVSAAMDGERVAEAIREKVSGN